MAIDTILVALALEDDSTRVAHRAVQLANQHAAQLVGVHVVEDLSPQDAGLPASIDAAALAGMLAEPVAQRLQFLLSRASNAVAHVEFGKAHDVIQRLAVSGKADLVVIGPGVARNLREKVTGSTADRVVRCAPCPVLVVRSDPASPYSRIAIGADFSDHAKAAARWAACLSPTALRELVHAVEIPLAFEQAMLKAGTSQADIVRYREAKRATAREQLIAAYGENGQLPPGTRARIDHGDPAALILKASRRRRIDLIAVGTQGAGPVTQHLLGSVARKVLAGAKCDVLCVSATALKDAPPNRVA